MIHWNVDPILVRLGPLAIRWYGFFFAIGFLAGYWILEKICRFERKPTEWVSPFFIYVALGTTIGARLGHCLFYDPGYYLSHPIEILKIWEGGLASHGGTLGVVVALYLFSRRHKGFDFVWLLDRVSIPVALVSSLIRLGNLMNSEIIGRPTTVKWAFIFERVDGFPRHPTQLYESFTYLLVFLILIAIYRRFRHQPPKGLLTGVLLFSIFLSRIFWEFFKENQEPFEANLPLNMGQILSIPFVLAGLWLIWRALCARAVEPRKVKRRG